MGGGHATVATPARGHLDCRRAARQTRHRYYAVEELVSEIPPKDRPSITELTTALQAELQDHLAAVEAGEVG